MTTPSKQTIKVVVKSRDTVARTVNSKNQITGKIDIPAPLPKWEGGSF